MVGIFAHDGGAFKPAASVPVNNGGTWQNAQEVWAKDNGVWVKVFPAIVREPATGENWAQGIFQWSTIPQIGFANITWNGTDMGNAPIGSITMKIGSWDYYRGTQKMAANKVTYYGLYRIGTP